MKFLGVLLLKVILSATFDDYWFDYEVLFSYFDKTDLILFFFKDFLKNPQPLHAFKRNYALLQKGDKIPSGKKVRYFENKF